MKKITIRDELTNTTTRYSLPAPFWKGWDEVGTGIFLTGIFIGKRSKRVIVGTYSQWEQRDGTCRGTVYRIADNAEIAGLCEKYDGLADVLESCGILKSEVL